MSFKLPKLPVSLLKDVQFVVAALAGVTAVVNDVLHSPLGPLLPTAWSTLLTGALTGIATVSGFLVKAEKLIDGADNIL